MIIALIALGVTLLAAVVWLVKSAEGDGAVKQELKQAHASMKETADVIKKADIIDKELAHYGDDAIDRVIDAKGWFRKE